MEQFDVIIIGASFAGLTLAHHLSPKYKVLLVDAKPEPWATVESTGLITTATKQELSSFCPIEEFITNRLDRICIVAPDYKSFFTSQTKDPWIYQTDTRGLILWMIQHLPKHVTFRSSTAFVDSRYNFAATKNVRLLHERKYYEVTTSFLVGADGGYSRVAHMVPGLSTDQKFLLGYEQVFYGDILLGPGPLTTAYHFWFGELALGYGGWLSPTKINGTPAFKIGLAKRTNYKRDAPSLLHIFTDRLLEERMVRIEGDKEKPVHRFGSLIPVGGVLKNISSGNCLLIGDAAGFCGSFAADGIKGAVVSGKEASHLIEAFLSGDIKAFRRFKKNIDQHDHLMHYYSRQLRYRKVWDMMKRNRTFQALYDILAQEKEAFLTSFCESKDKKKSLVWVILKWKHFFSLLRLSWHIFLDLFRPVV